MTEDEAVAIAIEVAARDFRKDDLREVRRVSYGEIASDSWGDVLSKVPPTPDQCVYAVTLARQASPTNAQGAVVVIDCLTGEVIHLTQWVA